MEYLIKHKKILLFFLAFMILSLSILQIFRFIFSDAISHEIIRNASINMISGSFLVIILYFMGYSIFKKSTRPPLILLAIIIPGILVAINNFPFSAFLGGRTNIYELNHVIYLFAIECLSTSLLEEVAFRGIILLLLIERLPKNKKGYLVAIIISSALFGIAHLVNLFNGSSWDSTLLQIVYSSFMGALWSVVFIATGNLLFPILLHASFNFFGLVLFRIGTVTNRYDSITIISTLVLAIITFIFYVFLFKSITDEDIDRILLSDVST